MCCDSVAAVTRRAGAHHGTHWLAGREYEWGQHVKIATDDVGFGEAEFEALAEGADASLWTPAEARLIRAADQLHYTTMLDDTLWHALASHYDQRQMIDTIFTAGQYRMVSVALNTLCVQLDDYLTPFAA